MNAILKAPADLLFFGGIGTYVRASTETDDAVGDRANDSIRVTGKELRCKVVGEGANLGMTQRGRIEAAQHGVRLNTDAIDNSAGVNTSDVEVNIKIALTPPMRDGRLTRDDRNLLLAQMTDNVASLVLRNNYLQPLALSLAERRGLEDLGFEQRLMQSLEVAGELDRAVEFLPDDMEIAERRRRSQALTRPELAVLLAYAKLSLNHRSPGLARCRTIRIWRASSAAISRTPSRSGFPTRSRSIGCGARSSRRSSPIRSSIAAVRRSWCASPTRPARRRPTSRWRSRRCATASA